MERGRVVDESQYADRWRRGQFSMMPGSTLTEALLNKHYYFNGDADDYKRLRRWFADYGVTVASYKKAMKLDRPTPVVDPKKLHDQLYYAELAHRG